MNDSTDTHETLSSSTEVQLGSDRTFGFVFAAVFAFISVYLLINGSPHGLWAGGISIAFLAIALLRPIMLRAANSLWFRLGLLLNKIMSPLVMGLVFFGTVLPTGLLMRVFGKRPLALNFDPTAESYWIKRDPAEPTPESMKKQF